RREKGPHGHSLPRPRRSPADALDNRTPSAGSAPAEPRFGYHPAREESRRPARSVPRGPIPARDPAAPGGPRRSRQVARAPRVGPPAGPAHRGAHHGLGRHARPRGRPLRLRLPPRRPDRAPPRGEARPGAGGPAARAGGAVLGGRRAFAPLRGVPRAGP